MREYRQGSSQGDVEGVTRQPWSLQFRDQTIDPNTLKVGVRRNQKLGTEGALLTVVFRGYCSGKKKKKKTSIRNGTFKNKTQK